MYQKTFSLAWALMLAGLIATPVQSGFFLKADKPPKPQSIEIVSYLSENNEALDQALEIHNLMGEMPSLRDTAQTISDLKEQEKITKEMLKSMSSCHAKKLGKVFKNPDVVWNKALSVYEQKRLVKQNKQNDPNIDKLTLSLRDRLDNESTGWTISRDILMDLYENPERWGAVNKEGAFPLWQDQISLFDKKWNQFYEELNASYGAPLKGRPAVDEETRHNVQKYDKVLAAHKAYVAQISAGKGKNTAKVATQNPPRAPKGLPRWQDIARIDPMTGKVTPEMPAPWKEMSSEKFKDYSDGGEMASFFEGKSLTPTDMAKADWKSALEQEYELNLAVDSIENGIKMGLNSQKEMIQPFIERLKENGVVVNDDFDISDRNQYMDVQKQLIDLKKKAMEDAYKYVERLEQQDKTHPKYAEKRKKLMTQKQARLSSEAQRAGADISDAIQVGQMSPIVQQKMTLAALEKDEKGSVYLTETNAINVDQLMRERKSTDKIIKESYQQVSAALEKQNGSLPQIEKCEF